MKLPQLKQIETFEAKIGDYMLTFRKAVISDSFLISRLSKEQDSTTGLLRIVAELMHGYDSTNEEKLVLLNSIPFTNIQEVTKDINNILKLAGLEQSEDKKKSVKR